MHDGRLLRREDERGLQPLLGLCESNDFHELSDLPPVLVRLHSDAGMHDVKEVHVHRRVLHHQLEGRGVLGHVGGILYDNAPVLHLLDLQDLVGHLSDDGQLLLRDIFLKVFEQSTREQDDELGHPGCFGVLVIDVQLAHVVKEELVLSHLVDDGLNRLANELVNVDNEDRAHQDELLELLAEVDLVDVLPDLVDDVGQALGYQLFHVEVTQSFRQLRVLEKLEHEVLDLTEGLFDVELEVHLRHHDQLGRLERLGLVENLLQTEFVF